MAKAAIAGEQLDRGFLDFLDILDAEALDVVVTLADYKAMTPGELMAWRVWKRARRTVKPKPREQIASAHQANMDRRAAWLRARRAQANG